LNNEKSFLFVNLKYSKLYNDIYWKSEDNLDPYKLTRLC